MATRRTRRRISIADHPKPSGDDDENEDDGDDNDEDASLMSWNGYIGRGSREEDDEIARRDVSMPAPMFSTPNTAIAAADKKPLELLPTTFYSSSLSSLSPSSLAAGGAGWRKMPLARGGAGFLAASSRFSDSAVAMSASGRKRRLEIGEE